MSYIICNIFFIVVLLIIYFKYQIGYKEKNGKIYHKWFHYKELSFKSDLIIEADATTFKTIKHNLKFGLAKDKNHVFLDSSILYGVSPKSFKQIKDYYWKDDKNVFLLQFGNDKIKVEEADPETFQIVNDNLWAKDRNNVFYQFDKLRDANVKEFLAIDEDWGKDKTYYYYHNKRLDKLDYKTAEIINAYYIKDKTNLYFGNKIVNGVNLSKFEVRGIGSFGHDDKFIYDWDKNKGLITEEYSKRYIDEKQKGKNNNT